LGKNHHRCVVEGFGLGLNRVGFTGINTKAASAFLLSRGLKANRMGLKSAQQQGRRDELQHARHADLVSINFIGLKIPDAGSEVKSAESLVVG
jgi:hypothetical protein